MFMYQSIISNTVFYNSYNCWFNLFRDIYLIDNLFRACVVNKNKDFIVFMKNKTAYNFNKITLKKVNKSTMPNSFYQTLQQI